MDNNKILESLELLSNNFNKRISDLEDKFKKTIVLCESLGENVIELMDTIDDNGEGERKEELANLSIKKAEIRKKLSKGILRFIEESEEEFGNNF